MGKLTAARRGRGTRGFTVIELLVTVMIVAVLTTLAVPSLTNLIQTQHVKTGASELQTSFFFARKLW